MKNLIQGNNMKRISLLFLAGFAILLLAGCAPGQGDFTKKEPAGFIAGIWHGWIAPVTLVISFFNDKIHMYEKNNTGFTYDLGFYIAVISGFGTIAFVRRRGR